MALSVCLFSVLYSDSYVLLYFLCYPLSNARTKLAYVFECNLLACKTVQLRSISLVHTDLFHK